MQICTCSSTRCHSSSLYLGQFAAACLKAGRNGIVFYTDPDVGATATGSLAEFLLVEGDSSSEELDFKEFVGLAVDSKTSSKKTVRQLRS